MTAAPKRHCPRPRRPARAIALGLAGALTLGACGSSDSGSSSSSSGATKTDKPIVIGMSLPLTGPVADRAKPGYEGYKYWAEEVNAKGGLLGRKVSFKVLDDGFDQKTAISDYTKLIGQSRVDLLLGTFSSDLNLAVAPIAERYKYVYVEPSGGADEIFERGFKRLFFAQPATTEKLPEQFVKMLSEAPADQRPKTAAFVTVEDPNTTQFEEILTGDLEKLGIKTVLSETYAPDAQNFDSIANKVKQAAPDLVVSGSIGGDGIALIRSFQKLGFSPDMFYQTNTPTDPTFTKAIGKGKSEGILTYLAYSDQATYPGNAEFVKGYQAKFGSPPSEDAANSYTAGQILAAGVEGAGSLDQDEIADWLHANEVQTIVGPLSWDAAGKSQGSMLLAQFKDDELEVIEPADVATSKDVVYRKPAW